MSLPENKIVDFIEEHHVLTIATCIDNEPWCANCFYAYWKEKNVFIFSSDPETHHAQNAIKNQKVAASIVLETTIVGKIQGLQISGQQINADNIEIGNEANKIYLKKYPFAVLKKSEIWILKPDILKLTDNRLGFGKKLIWQEK